MPLQLNPPPRVVIFAGPNGAGKSTHADNILASLGIETFVNADYIARICRRRNTEAVAFEVAPACSGSPSDAVGCESLNATTIPATTPP